MECINMKIEDVIKEYSTMVYRLAFAKTGNKFDADEVFQEVFYRYVKKNPMFNDKEHQKAWLLKVTVNCSKKLLKSSWKTKIVPLEKADDFVVEEHSDLHYELALLPSAYREVIHLFYYEDMSTEEIAKLLNRKTSTVRTQLTRARAMLKKYMKEEDYV